MTTPNIRCATSADFPRMLDITHRALREIATKRYPVRQVDQAIQEGAWTLKSTLIEKGHYFVAELDGTIEGGIGWDLESLGEADEPLEALPETANLRGLYINPDMVGRRLGSRLLKFCIADIQAAGYRHIELYASFIAESIFTRYGFLPLCQQRLVLSDDTAIYGRRMRYSFPENR